jgi:hypothetical protein
MSSQHATMEATVKSAGTTQLATAATNEMTKQATIDVAKSSVGYIPGLRGNDATFLAAAASANATLAQARYTAEMTKQCAAVVARDTMRSANTGEVQ